MSKFKPKAETMFEEKVQHFIHTGNWSRVEEVTKQYEAYLKLVEPMCSYEVVHTDEVGDVPVCQVHGNSSKHTDEADLHRPCLTIDPYSTELEVRPTDDPTIIEEQTYVLSGEAAAVEVETKRTWPWMRDR